MIRQFSAWWQTARDRLSIQRQIATWFAVVSGVLVLAATVGASLLVEGQALRDARDRARMVATSMAQRLDQEMFERFRQIRDFAELETLKPLWQNDPAALERTLDRIQASIPLYAWLGFAAPDGTVRAATKGMLRGKSVQERPWFQDGLKAPSVEDVHEAVRLRELLQASTSSAPFRFVDVAIPVKSSEGATLGVLGAHLSWAWADDARKTVLDQQDPEHRMDITIYSSNGAVLLGPGSAVTFDRDTLAQLSKQDPSGFTLKSEGGEMLASLVRTTGLGAYPGLGWLVMVRQPLDIAMAPAKRIAFMILGLGILIAFLGGVIAWAVARNLSRPIAALRSELDLVRREPERINVTRQHGSSDILALSTAIRSLLRRVSTAEILSREAHLRAEEAHVESDQFRKVADELSSLHQMQARKYGDDLERLRALSETDPLTGLLNRRGFLPSAGDTFALYKRYDRCFGLLVVDIDQFKIVNDRYGHHAGDAVIRNVGGILNKHLRATDKIARFGGEEFIVLIREVDDEGALLLAERMRASVEEMETTIGAQVVRVTISIGVTMVIDDDRDIEDIIERADRALYVAKGSGRNRVSVAPQKLLAPLQLAG